MRAAAVLVIAMITVPGVALAQRPTAPRARRPTAPRARLSINFGVQQPASTTFSATTTTPVYAETATVNTAYDLSSGKFFDGGVLIRVAGGFGVGAAVSSFTSSQTAAVTGTIPHPFFLNTLRPISGTTSPLERSEMAVHIQAGYVISSKRVDVAITGGPTFFNVSQDLVADATYNDTRENYPYDTTTFTGATISKVTATKLGFNAGVDVGIKLSKNAGVGGMVRFSRASITFPLANTASGVSADVGGVQAGGGVRFFF